LSFQNVKQKAINTQKATILKAFQLA